MALLSPPTTDADGQPGLMRRRRIRKNILGAIVIDAIFGLNDDIRRITGMVAYSAYAALGA